MSFLSHLVELLTPKKASPAPVPAMPVPLVTPLAAPMLPPTPVRHITREEILMGRDKEFPLTPALETNLEALLVALNKFRDLYGKPMIVSSGYRPGYYNVQAGGAPMSAHKVCMACDFADGDGALDAWIDANPKSLELCGLWREAPQSTKGWTHLDIRNRGPVRTFLP